MMRNDSRTRPRGGELVTGVRDSGVALVAGVVGVSGVARIAGVVGVSGVAGVARTPGRVLEVAGATFRTVWILSSLSLLLAGCGVFRGKGDDPTAWTVAEIGSDLTAWNEAHEALEVNAAASPAEPYWLHRIAELELVGAGGSVAAEPWLRRAIEVDPGYAPSLTLLSKLLYDEGRYYEAIDFLEPAVTQHVDRGAAEVRACLALHQVAVEEFERAEATLAPLEARGEHWAEVGSVLTYTRLHGANYREAPRWAERALEAEESAANCNNFGIALLQEGKPREAREQFLRALKLESELPGALYNLAIVERFYFFDDEAAADYYRRYVARSSEDPDGLAEIFGKPSSEQLSVSGSGQ